MSVIHRTCAFTGYRPENLGFPDKGERFEKLLGALYRETEKLIAGGYDIFITGMSRGVDIWAAGTVLELKRYYPHIKLCAAIPFEGQERLWNKRERERYYAILSLCATTKIVCDTADHSNVSACYHIRNRFMVDHSSALLAVYDDCRKNSSSGTLTTVRYAACQNKKIITINPARL